MNADEARRHGKRSEVCELPFTSESFPMNLSDPATPVTSPDTMEVCPSCSQRTAASLFRAVKKKRICIVCAHKAEKADATFRAQLDDRRYHGGLGWLWKHAAVTAGGAIMLFVVRSGLLRYFMHHH